MANNYTPNYNQYLTQTAGYALPSSVRSYSVFDPNSNTWRRMTNDGRSPMLMTPTQEQAAVAGALMQAQQTQGKVWNPLPAPVQGMAQTQTPGILLRPKQQAQPQPQPTRQVRRPLARGNAVDVSAAITPQPIVVNGETSIGVNGRGVTPSGIEFVGGQPVSLDRTQNIPPEYDGDLRSANGIPASSGVVGQPVVNVDSAEIGQSVPIYEPTPRLDMEGRQLWSEARKSDSLGRNLMTAFAAPINFGLALTGPGAVRNTLRGGYYLARGGLGVAPRAALTAPEAATASASTGSRLGSIRDAVTGLYNRAGGFLRREHVPTANFTVDAAGNAQATSPYTTNIIGDTLRNGYQTVRGWFTR